MDANGEIREASHAEDKVTAEKHSAGEFCSFISPQIMCVGFL